MNNQRQSIFPLLWVMLFDHMSLNIAFPILTLLFFDMQSRLFSADTTHAVRSMWYGLAVAIPHVINIFTTPLLSALSDEYGRKKILIVGCIGAFLFAITAAFGILLGSLTLLMLGLSIRGAFSRTNPIGQAVIGDLYPSHQKVIYMGYLQTAISIGAFIGPVIGGFFANQFFFQQLNFSLPYFIAAVFAAISWVLAVVLFQETLASGHQKKGNYGFNFSDIKNVFLNRQVLMVSSVLLLCQMSWSLYYQFMPPILKTRLNFDAHQLGWFVGMIALWLSLATTFGIRILNSLFSFQKMLVFSIYLILFGLILTFVFCWVPQLNWLIWLAAIPTAAGDVVAYSCLITLYSNAVLPGEQGKVMGVCFIVVALMWALTGLVGGMLMSIYELLPLLVAPLGIVFALYYLRKIKNE